MLCLHVLQIHEVLPVHIPGTFSSVLVYKKCRTSDLSLWFTFTYPCRCKSTVKVPQSHAHSEGRFVGYLDNICYLKIPQDSVKMHYWQYRIWRTSGQFSPKWYFLLNNASFPCVSNLSLRLAVKLFYSYLKLSLKSVELNYDVFVDHLWPIMYPVHIVCSVSTATDTTPAPSMVSGVTSSDYSGTTVPLVLVSAYQDEQLRHKSDKLPKVSKAH